MSKQISIGEKLEDLDRELRSALKNKVDAQLALRFLQEDFLPVMSSLVKFFEEQGNYVAEIDERLSALEEPDTQIAPEASEKMIVHLKACNSILEQLVATPGQPNASDLKEILENGRNLIAFIEEHTIEEGDEDEDEEDDAEA